MTVKKLDGQAVEKKIYKIISDGLAVDKIISDGLAVDKIISDGLAVEK